MHPVYKQPKFYRFNEDSVMLSKFAARFIKSGIRVLDLCAGSGVIGIEMSRNSSSNFEMDFLELQTEFIPSLKENIKNFEIVDARIFNCSLSDFQPDNDYDLVVCNPPYFVRGSGRPSPDCNRQIARTFEVDSIRELFIKVRQCLSESGFFVFCYPFPNETWESEITSQPLKSDVYRVAEYLNICILSKCNTNE
jgi:tRNA1Val (adenine37-N6)-methyltransferase